MGAENSKILNDYPDSVKRFNDGLTECIKNKDNVKFQSMIKNIRDPQDGRDCRGASLLHVAAEYGNAEIAEYLINIGFNLDLQDEYGRTALMIALKKQHFTAAKILLESNADIWARDTFGISALQITLTMDPVISPSAIPSLEWRYPYWQIVAIILDKVDDNYSSDSQKIADILLQIHCPLTHVVFMKNSEVMRIMIEKGCSINARNRFTGKTALHLAVCFWMIDKVKLLLNNGADVNILDYRKNTPLMCVYRFIHFLNSMPICEEELVDILLKQKPKFFETGEYNAVRQMHDLFRFGSKDAVRLALETNPDLFLARYVTYHSLLHIIARNSNPEIEEVIRGKNMEVDSGNHCGDTALVDALKFRNDKIVECLLNEGASLDIQNSAGITPMHVPFQFEDLNEETTTTEKRLKCIKMMLEHGGDPEITFENEDTILEVVARNGAFVLAEPVLAQFAIRQISKIPISKVIRDQIKEHKEYETYFDSRVNELQDAKTSVICSSVTVFDILTKNNKMILLYARNRGLVSKLTDLIDQLKLDSYYMGILWKRFSKVSKIAELRNRAAGVVCKNIGKLYQFNAVITNKIVDYLDDEDILKLL